MGDSVKRWILRDRTGPSKLLPSGYVVEPSAWPPFAASDKATGLLMATQDHVLQASHHDISYRDIT
jgi:hypothetical protein